jgi:ubiquitin C-terminal hydrolase
MQNTWTILPDVGMENVGCCCYVAYIQQQLVQEVRTPVTLPASPTNVSNDTSITKFSALY